jgi:hypothetical protein
VFLGCFWAYGPIFLRRFRLYVSSFMFRFMFVNICFEKYQNIKIHVMFITKHNMKWNRDLQFLGCLGSQGSREKSSFKLCKFSMLSINMNHNIGFFSMKKCYATIHVWLHDMDHNIDLNYRRKIRPMCSKYIGPME